MYPSNRDIHNCTCTCTNTYGLLTLSVRSRWLDVGQVLFFFACLWSETNSSHETKSRSRDGVPLTELVIIIIKVFTSLIKILFEQNKTSG